MPLPATTNRKNHPPPTPNPDNQLDQEFLQKITPPNATPEEIQRIGKTWLIAQEDINKIKNLPPTNNSEENLRREIHTAITAAATEAAINQHGEIRNTRILTATPEQHNTWADAYYDNLTENYKQQIETLEQLARLEGEARDREALKRQTGWLTLRNHLQELRETFDRQAAYLWECQEMNGLNTVLAKHNKT